MAVLDPAIETNDCCLPVATNSGAAVEGPRLGGLSPVHVLLAGPEGGAAGSFGCAGNTNGGCAAKAGETTATVEADRTKLFCGLRNGGSYAFDAIRCGAAGLGALAGGLEGPARGGARLEGDRCGAY